MSSFIYKPSTRKGPVFLASEDKGPPVYTTADGQKYTGVRGDAKGGSFYNEGNYQYVFPNQVLQSPGGTITYGGETGKVGNSQLSYRGSSLGNWQESMKGAVGDPGSSGFGAGGQFGPGTDPTGFGFYPGYQNFPNPTFANFNSIKPQKPIKYDPMQSAPYQFTDPMEFSKKYSEFNKDQIRGNLDLSKDIALSELDTELEGLTKFAPAAGALKRNELNIDNIFNQEQRTRAVNTALPTADANLTAQEGRAQSYAEGRVPDPIQDRALELNARSNAADRASAGGFGAKSQVSRKVSDLMSAEERVQLSQYGDTLLSNNINQRANLFLAPTSYSDAGAQIRVTPEVGGARLQAGALSDINNETLISAGQAYQGTVQQNQFTTGLEQQTRQFNTGNALNVKEFNAGNALATAQFNAQGEFQESQFNAGTANSFALQKFSYDVGYAGAVAGAYQTGSNTAVGLQQQAQYGQIYQDQMKQTQSANQAGAISSGAAAIPGIISGLGSTVSAIGGLLGYGSGSSQSSGGTSPGGAASSGEVGAVTGGSNIDYTPSNVGSGEASGGAQGSISVPSGSSTPDGYTPVSSVALPDGSAGTIAVPDYALKSQVASFAENTGFSTARALTRDPNKEVTKAMLTQSASTLSNAGIYSEPVPGSQPAGYANNGSKVYFNSAAMSSADPSQGTKMVGSLRETLEPLGTFDGKDQQTIDHVERTVGSPELLNELDALHQKGDTAGFINTMTESLGQESPNKNPDVKAGMASAYSAYNLFQHWDRLSPTQKALGAASVGIQGYKFQDGKNLADKPIVKPNAPGEAGLDVKEALNLFKDGHNVYGLVKNWDQMNAIQKIASGKATASSMANTGTQMGLLGVGTQGAAVPNITKEQLSKDGWKFAGQYGVGAVAGNTQSKIPKGYTTIAKTKDGGVIAIPQNTADTGVATIARRAGSVVGTPSGKGGVGADTDKIYNNWKKTDKPDAQNGAAGGTAMAAGLYKAAKTTPFITSGVAAHSVTSNTARSFGVPPNPKFASQAVVNQPQKFNKEDPIINQSIQTIQAAVNAFAKNGSETAQMGAPYINAVAAGKNLYDVLKNPNSTAEQKADATAKATQAGTAVAASLGSETAKEAVPYINYAMAAYNASKVLGSNMSGEDKAKALRQTGENTVASIYTLGLSNVAQAVDQQFLGGKGQELRNKLEKLNPMIAAQDKVAGKFIGAASNVMGGKSGDQQDRDSVRKTFNGGTKDFTVTLANGEKADIGIDGHGGSHEVSNPDKLTKEQSGVKKLNAWDTDYTNDLDFAAGMGGTALSRLISGGKSTAVDQFGGQLGNAFLSGVGYGKEMTEANFSKTMANARAVYAQKGIKSKADGYQLANQAFSEGRINESDLLATHQALNMMYDDNGFQAAQSLMSGRWRGVEVANEQAGKEPATVPEVKPFTQRVIPSGNKQPGFRPASISNPIKTESTSLPSTGPKNFINRPIRPSRNMSKEDLRKANQMKYQVEGANAA